MTMAFTDVNFQIAMLEEQKKIFTKYSEFLNYFDPSLHLEINLVTRSMDEEQFRRDTFLPLRGDDRDRYAEEMNQVVAEKALRGQNGLIREKYVTFSLHAENYQQAKEQLENRAADIADHFKRMGSSTRILSGIERLSLLQGIMRPNEEMSFSYDWLLAEDDLTTKDFISPSSYNWHPEHDDSRAVYRDRYEFGDKIGKTMYLRGIAPEMKNGLFSMLSELPFDHVITMHVDAMDQAEAVQEIEKKLAYMHKEEYDAIAKARERNMPASIAVSYDLKSKMHHTEQMMDDITTKNQKIFKVCILIHTYGDSNAQLDERVRRICSTVQQQTCRFDSILYEQCNAMNSMLPLGKKWLGLERTLETVSTAIYVPFTTQELFQPGGLYEGINARSKNLILCNRKLLPAPAGMVLGMTGYGKSFSVMQMVTNIMLRWPDDDIVLIDPEQEYTHLVTAMGGVVIDISASSPSHINPMDITEDYGDDEDPIRLKSQFLQNFCQLILHSSELSPQERTFIDVAAGLTYQRYMANPKREEMPTLHDFYRYDITYDDGTHGTIRGTDLIRQIDEENLTQPLIVSLTADQIMAMSLRGVTVHLPQYGIERLFIPKHYVQRNVEQGSCEISLYPGWQYSYVPTGSEKTRKAISGAELAQSLGGVVQVDSSADSLARRVANVERRAGIANAQELGKLLGSMADNGLHSAADFDKQINAYRREEMKLRNEVAELRSKSRIYAATAHNLQACRTYKSVWLEYASKPLTQKDTFCKQNEAALQAYSRAASQLDKMGISLGTEPEKVRQLVTETEIRIADLIAELEKVRKSNRAIQEDKEKIEQIQGG